MTVNSHYVIVDYIQARVKKQGTVARFQVDTTDGFCVAPTWRNEIVGEPLECSCHIGKVLKTLRIEGWHVICDTSRNSLTVWRDSACTPPPILVKGNRNG